ncbi:MAG: hypothetical protein GYA43_12130 [Bacteroidales bacterium]|nr:hypothetical protein [Bacteroidales bacterium]
MESKRQKLIFTSLALILLAIMIAGSRKAGVSCDEVLHYNHSVSVNNYYSSGGKDLTCLNTPGTHLKYYGQSYDNLTTLLIRVFGIGDIYGFRHLMATLAGWLSILLASLLAWRVAGFTTGITALLLFAVSPTFLGHAQNNLKDIPFALGYLAGIYSIIRFLASEKRIPARESVILIISIAFCMSIRAGGMLLICYLYLFFLVKASLDYFKGVRTGIKQHAGRLLLITLIACAAWFLSVLYWPYGLRNPVLNPLRAHLLMSRFPLTFREIFEGSFEWTDYMPWYYLLKYMIVTIPLSVLAGAVLFVFRLREAAGKDKIFQWSVIVFSVLFPVIYEIITKPNIYSGWRQFLFLYPGLVIMASAGITGIISMKRVQRFKPVIIFIFVLLSVHPAKFLIGDYRYAYLYFNELAGGVKGANGNYETDYYFIGQAEAAEWLVRHLEKTGTGDTIVVASNFSAEWYFRNMPLVKNVYLRNEERSCYDWDYYLSTNRYILPFRLRGKLWPPGNSLYVARAGGAPVCAVIQRTSKDDYLGFKALNENRPADAGHLFERALSYLKEDEMIFYNFAVALNRSGDSLRADSVLKQCLAVNPFFEPALMYSGIISARRGEYEQASEYFRRLIEFNRKYSEAYVELARVVARTDTAGARSILRQCLRINPAYKPAVVMLAGLYRESDPEMAGKYDSIAIKLK